MSTAAFEEDFYAECSDEELYNPEKCESPLVWQPRPAEIARLYEALSSGAAPSLAWRCPGRTKPTQNVAAAEPDVSTPRPQVSVEEPPKARIVEEFEKDETVTEKASATIRVGVSKPTRPQKKVASFDAIYQDVLLQKKAELSEKEQN